MSKQILPSITITQTWLAALVAAVYATLASASNPKLVYVETDLEAIVGSRFVQAMIQTEGGETLLGTQTGIVSAQFSSTSSSAQGSALTQTAKNLDVIAISHTDSDAIIAMTANGIVLEHSYSTARQGSFRYPTSTPSHSVYEIEVNGVRYLAVQSKTKVDLVSLEANTDSSTLSASIEINLQLKSNILYFPKLGICGISKNEVLCGLEKSDENWIAIHELSVAISSAHLISSNESLILIDSGFAQVIDTRRINSPTTASFPALNDIEVRKVINHGETILIGTDRGLFQTDTALAAIKKLEIGEHRRVNGFYTNDTGVWVLCETGIAYLAMGDVDVWPPDYSVRPIEVLSFSETQDALLVGTYEGVFSIPHSGESYELIWSGDIKTDDKRVTSIAFSGEKLYLGSFSRGITELSYSGAGFDRLVNHRHFDSLGITSLLTVDDILIVGTHESGILALIDGEEHEVPMPTSWLQTPSPITSLTRTKQSDRIIFTSENEVGILCISSGVRICASQVVIGTNRQVRIVSSAMTDTEELLLGTLSAGVLTTHLTDIELQGQAVLPTIPATSSFPVFGVKIGVDGDAWLGTSSGLKKLIRSSDSLRDFGPSHRLINADINHGAFFTDNQGRHHIGGPYGYNSFGDNSFSEPTSEQTTIYLRAASVAGKRFSTGLSTLQNAHLLLEPEVNDFTLELTVNDFRHLSSNRYQHYLQGHDKDWIDDGDRSTITYSNLPPGDYIFRARGANSLGVWSENEIEIPVRVLPPTWQSWWAITLYLALASLLVWAGKRIYDRQLLRHYALVQAREDAAALARLEDDYQEQLESNERLLQNMASTSQNLLGLVQNLLQAQLAKDGVTNAEILKTSLDSVNVLQLQQAMTRRTLRGDTVNLKVLAKDITDEVGKSVADARPVIVLSDAPDMEIPASHAACLALVMHEMLVLGTTGRDHDPKMEPIIHLVITGPDTSADTTLYALRVEDSGYPDLGDRTLDQYLSFTLQLLEAVGGDVQQSHGRGNLVEVSLQLS